MCQDLLSSSIYPLVATRVDFGYRHKYTSDLSLTNFLTLLKSWTFPHHDRELLPRPRVANSR